jgi:uncharacterized Zn finger protein (UPF0148 family)
LKELIMNGTLRESFELFNRGEKQQAAKLLAALVLREPYNASAWYGLALCLDDTEKQTYCLNKVLSINPNHTKAKQMIETLSAKTEMKACPFCGADNQDGAVVCSNCGRDLVVNSSLVKEPGDNHLHVSYPETFQDKKQSAPRTRAVRWNVEETRFYSTLKGGIIILILIGVISALMYAFYQMDSFPTAIPASILSNTNPSNPIQPPTAAPKLSTIAGTAAPNPSSITPPYFEDFSDGPGIWNVRDDAEVSFTVSDGKYLIEPKRPGGAWWTSPRAKLDNILLEFSTSFMYTYPLEDGGLRVNFRCVDSDEEECYKMFVSENGYLFVHREEDILVEHKLSQHINLYDHPNQWAIVMDGSNFEIHCNGELLATFSDSNYESGDFGFGVFNSENDEWGFNGVTFDNIRVSLLE